MSNIYIDPELIDAQEMHLFKSTDHIYFNMIPYADLIELEKKISPFGGLYYELKIQPTIPLSVITGTCPRFLCWYYEDIEQDGLFELRKIWPTKKNGCFIGNGIYRNINHISAYDLKFSNCIVSKLGN